MGYKDANILAEETLFIEDSAQHIEGAKQATVKNTLFRE